MEKNFLLQPSPHVHASVDSPNPPPPRLDLGLLFVRVPAVGASKTFSLVESFLPSSPVVLRTQVPFRSFFLENSSECCSSPSPPKTSFLFCALPDVAPPNLQVTFLFFFGSLGTKNLRTPARIDQMLQRSIGLRNLLKEWNSLRTPSHLFPSAR